MFLKIFWIFMWKSSVHFKTLICSLETVYGINFEIYNVFLKKKKKRITVLWKLKFNKTYFKIIFNVFALISEINKIPEICRSNSQKIPYYSIIDCVITMDYKWNIFSFWYYGVKMLCCIYDPLQALLYLWPPLLRTHTKKEYFGCI